MPKIVELQTDDGHVLSFEARDIDGQGVGYAPASRDDSPVRRRFDEAFDDLRALARSLTDKLDTPDLRPDGIEIEVGVTVSAKAGIVFTSAAGEATMSVKMTWNRKPDAA